MISMKNISINCSIETNLMERFVESLHKITIFKHLKMRGGRQIWTAPSSDEL